MKKRFYISFLFCLLLSCMFVNNVFANSTIVSLEIFEISLKGNDNGYFYVDGEKLNTDKSFFRKKGDSIEIKVEPKEGYYFKGVTCESDSTVLVSRNNIKISNLKSNVFIELNFKEGSPSTGGNGSYSKTCPGGNFCPTNHLKDVVLRVWYHEDVDYVVENGIMKGTAYNAFEPHSITTRAMLVTMLYRLEDSPKVSTKNTFDDVERGSWCDAAITWANSKGIVLGYGNDNFGTNDYVTREQMVTILYRYARYKKYSVKIKESNITKFSDVNTVSDWAYDAIRWACGENIIKGSDGKLLPNDGTERAQIAAVFHRFCEKYE